MDLYSFCSGDPINQFDADGRFGKSLAYGVRNALDNGSEFLSGAWNGAGYWASSTYASWGNTLDSALFAVVNPWSPLTASRNFSGGYEPDPSYVYNFEQGSSIYQAGHNFGYYGAEFGFQASLALGASAFEGIASGAALNRARSLAVTSFEAQSMLAADWQAAQRLYPSTKLPASTFDTIPEGNRLMLRPIEIQFPAKGLTPEEQELFTGHLAEQELKLNQLSLHATDDLKANLLNYQNVKQQVDISRALARGYLPGDGEGLHAAHSLDAVAGGYIHDFAGFRSPVQSYIGSLWRTRASLIRPGKEHRLVPLFTNE